MNDQANTGRTRSRRNRYRKLIHLLNQRYHQQWERAEALELQLAEARSAWWGPALAWLRRVKRWLRPYRYTGRPGSKPGELVSVPFQKVTEAQSVGTACVSIIIPFKNRHELLRDCLRSLHKSSYRHCEIILVDNGSRCLSTLRYVHRLEERGQATVLRCPGPFNFSRLCNLGARAATGDFLLFLNNDVEALTPDWLERMLRVAVRPEVGIVGAMLLYPGGAIQHAGLYPRADGHWVHAYRGLPQDARGDQHELGLIRTVPAVTGACLMIGRELFNQVAGFDEILATAFNDVDLCRRVQKLGKLVTITPHARLLHYEALSRGFAADPPACLEGPSRGAQP